MTTIEERPKAETVSLWVYYDYTTHELDEQIREIVGRDNYGSGFDLILKQRDLSFDYGIEEGDALGQTIVRLAKLDGVTRVAVL